MISKDEASLFFSLDKERPASPASARAQRLDPRLKAAWLQFQAVRALSLEASPEPGERSVRAVLERCRKARVRRQLAGLTGEETAREILSSPSGRHSALPAWLLAALACAIAGTTWLAFRAGDRTGWNPPRSAPVLDPGVAPTLPFEFPVATSPVAEALAQPGDGTTDADDVHAESKVERQASRLLREHLHEVHRRSGQGPHTGVPRPRQTPKAPVPKPPAPGFTLSADSLLSAEGAASAPAGVSVETQVTLELPQRRDVDVRLFSADGRSLRVLASGACGPGAVELTLTARDDQGKALAPGAYYLRVMTPWFSRVEIVQVH